LDKYLFQQAVIMAKSRLSEFRQSARLLALQWLLILIVLPILAYAFGALLHLTTAEVLHEVMFTRRSWLVVLVTCFIALKPLMNAHLKAPSNDPGRGNSIDDRSRSRNVH